MINDLYDPALRPFVDAHPALPELTVAAFRARVAEGIARAPQVDTSGLTVDDRTIPGPDGDQLAIRVYQPHEPAGTPSALLYFHGGGFVCGDIEAEHSVCTYLAREAGVTVVSVNYRLAPEHPFPAALEDGFTALQWLADNAGSLGVRTDRLAVGGASAGGNLAGGLSLLARDRGGPALRLQLLMNPTVAGGFDSFSMQNYVGPPSNLGLETCQFLRSNYVGGQTGDSDYLSPAQAADLSGLPRTYVGVSQYDPLRDEGIDYARALMSAGVPTELHMFPATLHVSFFYTGAPVSRREAAAYAAGLRAGLTE